MSQQVIDVEKCFEVAKSVALKAGKVIREAYKQEKRIELKSSAVDLVTETDQFVETLVINTIKESFPSHSFIGEESTATGVKNELTDGPTWIIDPIDGTTNFVHTFPYACISIGFLLGKKAQVGVIYNPVLEEMYTAQSGKGAYLNDKRIHVSNCQEMKKALVVSSHGYSNEPEVLDILYKNMRYFKANSHGIRSVGSAALSMCLVASGAADVYYEYGIHCWDIAAGMVIAEEAGALLLDPQGGPLDLMNRGILAACSKPVAESVVKNVTPIKYERD